MKKKTLISVILPVRNSENFLEKCLESISNQSYADFEVIAIDDLSTDSSYQILKNWAKLDKRFKIFKNKKNYGVSVCFNRGITRAKGTFVTFMNSEDVLSKNRFNAQVKFLLSNPKIVAVGTQSAYVNQKNKKQAESNFPIAHESICKALLPGRSMQFDSALINRLLLPKDLLKFKPNRTSLLLRELFVKLINYGELANLPVVLHIKRIDSLNQPAMKNMSSFIKLAVKTAALPEFPSLRSLISFPRTQ